MARVFMDSRSAALAAKHRQRGPSVLERLRADEEAAAQAAAVASERWAKRRKTAPVVQPPPECTGGMAMKTGMVLARAQLAESTSGVVAARDRQAALVGKGYRQAEKVAQEQPVGTLATKDMPKRKGSALDKAQFKEAFTTEKEKKRTARLLLLKNAVFCILGESCEYCKTTKNATRMRRMAKAGKLTVREREQKRMRDRKKEKSVMDVRK